MYMNYKYFIGGNDNNEGSNLTIIIFVFIVLLCLIGIIVYFFLNSNTNSNKFVEKYGILVAPILSQSLIWLDAKDITTLFNNQTTNSANQITGNGQSLQLWKNKGTFASNIIWSNGITYNTSTPNNGEYPSLRLNSRSTTTINVTVTSIFYVVSYTGGSVYSTYSFPGLLGNGGYDNYLFGHTNNTNIHSQLIYGHKIYINGNDTRTVPDINKLAIIEVFSTSPTNLVNAMIGSGDSGLQWDGYVCEIIMFNTVLTVEQRQIIEGYLANKWGLLSSLPANHPYKK